MNRLVQISDAIVSELNAHVFSQAFVAARTWNPKEDLENLTQLTVRVVPVDVSESPLSRTSIDGIYSPQIAVIKRVFDDSECDEMAQIMQEMADYLTFEKKKSLDLLPSATLQRVDFNPLYNLDLLREMRLWFGVLVPQYLMASDA